MTVVEQTPEFSRAAAAVMRSQHVLDLPAEQQWALREAIADAANEADLPDHLRTLFEEEMHAAIVESVAYVERLHPRDRRGHWIEKYHGAFRTRTLPVLPEEQRAFGPGLLRGEAKRGRQKGRKPPLKRTARKWRERVEELRQTPILPQDWIADAYRNRRSMWDSPWADYGPSRWKKGQAIIVSELREGPHGLQQGYELFVGGQSRGWEPVHEHGAALNDVLEARAPEIAKRWKNDELETDYWGLTGGMRGSIMAVTGDPGVLFEAQHGRIMEAGASIDAEVTRRMRPALNRLRDAEKAVGAKHAELAVLDNDETRLAYEAVRKLMGDDAAGLDWQEIQHARVTYVIQSVNGEAPRGDHLRPWTPEEEADGLPRLYKLGRWAHEYWESRYNVEGVDVQAAHDKVTEQRWGNEPDRLPQLTQNRDAAKKALMTARRDAAYDALGEIREMGTTGTSLGFTVEEGPGAFAAANEGVKVPLERASRWIPTDWISTSNFHGKLAALWDEDGRGRYRHRGDEAQIRLSRSAPAPGVIEAEGVALHELVHRIEHVRDGVKGAEWTFYTSRVSPGQNRAWEEPKLLSEVTGNSSYKPEEKTRTDHFTDAYSGKTYGDGMTSSYEILTMGIEDLVTGRHGIIEQDDEYRHFVLGALALL